MKILLAVDGSKHSLKAVRCLIEHAGGYREKPVVELVNVRLPVPRIRGMSAVVGATQIRRYYDREGGAAHRRAGTRGRESPEQVPRRSAVEGRGGDPQERSQFAHTPPALGEGRAARHAPGHRERARNDRRGRPEGGPVHRGDRKNYGDVREDLVKNSPMSAPI